MLHKIVKTARPFDLRSNTMADVGSQSALVFVSGDTETLVSLFFVPKNGLRPVQTSQGDSHSQFFGTKCYRRRPPARCRLVTRRFHANARLRLRSTVDSSQVIMSPILHLRATRHLPCTLLTLTFNNASRSEAWISGSIGNFLSYRAVHSSDIWIQPRRATPARYLKVQEKRRHDDTFSSARAKSRER